MSDEALVFDPRAFIAPPYATCPLCGAPDGLGVLMIQSDHLVRRCRECLRPSRGDPPARVPLPEVRKRVLYLDQFAISNAMYRAFPDLDPEKHDRAVRWQELFTKIQHLVQIQALVCPSSGFHVDEALPFAHGSTLQRTWTMLSAGTRFDEASEIEGKQLIRAAELWDTGATPESSSVLRDPVIEPNLHGWTDRLHVTVNLSFYDGIKDDIATARSSLSDSLQHLFDKWATDCPTFAEQMERELSTYGPTILGTVLEFETAKVAFWNGSGTTMPMPSNPVMRFKSLEYTFTRLGHGPDEATERVVAFLNSDAVRHVSKVRLGAMLFAGLARKIAGGMKPAAMGNGIATDVAMVSTLLPYCDAMLVDRFVGALMHEQPIADYVDTLGALVFSAATLDRLVGWLDGIAASVGTEHLAAVRNAYGDEAVDQFCHAFSL